jgi:RNA polymerase sigma-70 factor (ECF subfamily)
MTSTDGSQRPAPRDAELGRAILARCKRGEPLAFRVFVRHYERAVFTLLSRFVGASPEIDDLAQETFFRAFRAFGSFDLDSPSRPSSWLLTIAVRLALDEKRCRAARARALAETADPAVDPSTPETTLAEREIGSAIAAAGAELPPDQRAAFILAEFHDLTTAEIAQALSVPENTVKSRLFRARQHMRARLELVRQEVADGAE